MRPAASLTQIAAGACSRIEPSRALAAQCVRGARSAVTSSDDAADAADGAALPADRKVRGEQPLERSPGARTDSHDVEVDHRLAGVEHAPQHRLELGREVRIQLPHAAPDVVLRRDGG